MRNLERQSEEDPLWIRDEFLNSWTDFGKVVEHGHTPTDEPEALSNTINIETGAFATGGWPVLCCRERAAWLRHALVNYLFISVRHFFFFSRGSYHSAIMTVTLLAN